jgi:hypothetical protein
VDAAGAATLGNRDRQRFAGEFAKAFADGDISKINDEIRRLELLQASLPRGPRRGKRSVR